MTKKFDLKPTLVLCAICVVMVALLAVVNMITAPIIAAQQNAAANEALLVVLPDGKNFEEINLADAGLPSNIDMAYKEAGGGFVFRVTVAGKNPGLMIMFGINGAGEIVGTKVISEAETDAYDVNVFPGVEGTEGAYKGMTLDTFEPWLVGGATLTSKAYGEAAKLALSAYAVLSGGEVDFRTPEEILQDNCNAALGTTGVTFTKWFALATLDGVDKVYEAKDGSGRVYVIGETFVGVKADGTVVNGGAASENAKATAANAVIEAITLTDVAIPAGTSNKKAEVLSIKVTNNGAYVFELLGYGYQYMFDYGDGTPIKIRLSIDADGKIIDVLTLSHNESQGFGDACGNEEYYEQYKGQGNENIKESAKDYPWDHEDYIASDTTDIGAIASATYTTLGYQRAVKLAFSVFEVLTAEGGNE